MSFFPLFGFGAAVAGAASDEHDYEGSPDCVRLPIRIDVAIPNPTAYSCVFTRMSHPSETLPKDDVEAIDELRQTYQRLNDELKKIVVGQQQVIEQLAICLFRAGARIADGGAGAGEDAADQPAGGDDVAELQPDSVYAGPDADGYHWHGHPAGAAGREAGV
jgi:hypothetical protein